MDGCEREYASVSVSSACVVSEMAEGRRKPMRQEGW